MKRLAALRVCASCEWIFKIKDKKLTDCPMCGFGSYGAWCVYGNNAYHYAKTQKHWKNKEMFKHETKLNKIIKGGRYRQT